MCDLNDDSECIGKGNANFVYLLLEGKRLKIGFTLCFKKVAFSSRWPEQNISQQTTNGQSALVEMKINEMQEGAWEGTVAKI